jgi:hypothetical protein
VSRNRPSYIFCHCLCVCVINMPYVFSPTTRQVFIHFHVIFIYYTFFTSTQSDMDFTRSHTTHDTCFQRHFNIIFENMNKHISNMSCFSSIRIHQPHMFNVFTIIRTFFLITSNNLHTRHMFFAYTFHYLSYTNAHKRHVTCLSCHFKPVSGFIQPLKHTLHVYDVFLYYPKL